MPTVLNKGYIVRHETTLERLSVEKKNHFNLFDFQRNEFHGENKQTNKRSFS